MIVNSTLLEETDATQVCPAQVVASWVVQREVENGPFPALHQWPDLQQVWDTTPGTRRALQHPMTFSVIFMPIHTIYLQWHYMVT